MRTTIIAAIVCLPLFACGERTPEPRGLEIVVSPLTLSGVDEAIYTLEVKSKTGTVWRQEGLRSTRYGDGRGALTYIGTCDASDGANPHTVTLVLEELWADGVELDDPKDFKNPAPAPAGLTLTNITCVENSDTLVRFDLTVLRAARQGFFDIAVEFQDVFCSAKLDCVDELLHYPPGHAAGDGRGPTAVVGFACTAGEDDDDTYLYLNAPRIICGAGANEQVFSLPPNGLPGNQGPLGTIAYQSAIYVGQEAFTEFDKCYWNFAFGIDLTSLAALTPCRIEVQGTASGTPFVAGMSPAGVFPVITWSAPLGLDTTGETPQLDCGGPHPLNGIGSGVQTDYTDFAGEFFAYQLDCDGGTITTPNTTCQRTIGGQAVSVDLVGTDEFTVTVGGTTSTSYRLQPGRQVARTIPGRGDVCCVDPCCDATPPVAATTSTTRDQR